MTDQEEQSPKEARQKEKRTAEEAGRLAKDKVRKEAYLAREQAIEKDLKAKKSEESEKRAAEDIEQLARDQARREAFFADEQAMAEAQEARKLKAKKEPPE
jgi:hypothetical protein